MPKKAHRVAELAAMKIDAMQREKAAEETDRYLRLAAEFDNYKKRIARQFGEIVDNANEGLIIELLDVADDLERALNAVGREEPSPIDGNDHLYAGTKLIFEKLMNLLKNRGVRKMEALGTQFDPNLHEAVMQAPSEQAEGTVIEVISPGYIRENKVIRHARVVVASSPDE